MITYSPQGVPFLSFFFFFFLWCCDCISMLDLSVSIRMCNLSCKDHVNLKEDFKQSCYHSYSLSLVEKKCTKYMNYDMFMDKPWQVVWTNLASAIQMCQQHADVTVSLPLETHHQSHVLWNKTSSHVIVLVLCCVCVHPCMHICVCVRTCVHPQNIRCMCVCVCACMHMCVCVH